MRSLIYGFFTLTVFVLECTFGARHLCKGRGCSQSNFFLTDDSVDYDDKHLHFRHSRPSKQPLSFVPSRHIPDIRATNKDLQHDYASGRLFSTNEPSQPRMPRASIHLSNSSIQELLKCFQCETFPSEPQCGTDRNSYANSCYRECANNREGVKLHFMGKCPDCNCKQTWEAECTGGGDTTCLDWCGEIKYQYKINCTGHKLTNGPCICAQERFLGPSQKQCGSDGIFYADSCRRECAGVATTIRPQFCDDCWCTYVLDVECGRDLGFKPRYTPACIQKCKQEITDMGDSIYTACKVGPVKGLCKCQLDLNDREHCGTDNVLYEHRCALRCAGVKGVRKFQKTGYNTCEPI